MCHFPSSCGTCGLQAGAPADRTPKWMASALSTNFEALNEYSSLASLRSRPVGAKAKVISILRAKSYCKSSLFYVGEVKI